MKGALNNRGYKNTQDIVWETGDKKCEKFWIPLSRIDKKTKKPTVGGKLLCSIRLYPKDKADQFE